MTLCLPFHHRLDEQDDSAGINENFIPFNNERIELEPHICWMRDARCAAAEPGPTMPPARLKGDDGCGVSKY